MSYHQTGSAQRYREWQFYCLSGSEVDVDTEEVVGAEAVVRYHHKDLGIMNPGKYLTLLEETKLSHYLDLYVFEEVCKTLRRWETEDLPMIPIAVILREQRSDR